MLRLIPLGLLLVAWLTALHYLPWISWHCEVLAFAAALLLPLGFICSKRGTGRLDVPRALIIFGGVAVAVALQAATGLLRFWGDAWVLLLYLGMCMAALASGWWWQLETAVGPGPERSRVQPGEAVAWTLLAGAVASSFIALVQVFEVWEGASWILRMPSTRRPGANLGQPNHLATLFLMGLGSLVYLNHGKRMSTGPAVLIAAVLAVGLAATESRTGLLSLLVLCGWAIVGRQRAGLRLNSVAIVTFGLLASAMFVCWPWLLSSVQAGFQGNPAVNMRLGLRMVVWPQLISAALDRPWLGWGLRQVSEAHNSVAWSYGSSEPYTYAHNIVLEIAIGLGIPAAAAIVFAVMVWLWRRVSHAKSPLAWYCLAAVLPFAVHSLLEFPYAYAYLIFPVVLLVGVLEAELAPASSFQVRRSIASVSLGAVGILGVWSVVEYVSIEEDFRIARFEALRIGQTPAEYRRPNVIVLSQLDALLHGARILPRPGMDQATIDLAQSVALRYPWPATQNRYALTLALNGAPREAHRQLQVLRALHGEATYAQIKANWSFLSEQHPVLREVVHD